MRYACFVMCIAAALLAGSSRTAAAASEAEEKLERVVTSELRMSWSSIQEEYANANSEFLVCESEAGKDKKAIKECRSARRETKRELFDRVDNIVVAAEENMESFIRASQARIESLCVASEEWEEHMRRSPARGVMQSFFREHGGPIAVVERVCGEVRTGDLYLEGVIGE